MTRNIIQHALAILAALGPALSLPAQERYRIPNDRTGVGANGTIGRGTTPGEYFIRTTPVPTRSVPYYDMTPMPVTATPAAVDATPSHIVNLAEIKDFELALSFPALARNNPWMLYHRGWVNGYWNAHRPNTWTSSSAGYAVSRSASWRSPSSRLGVGLGWGLPAWMIGPMAYNWGYFHYDNPYYVGPSGGSSVGAEQPAIRDYSRPINAPAALPTETELHDALTTFQAARDAFQQEDYLRALNRADEALSLTPNDPMLHQFRALVLFSLGRYDEAAATLYALVVVLPGWDWRTMVNLYNKMETFTRQLRLLEDYSHQNPRSEAAHFVRAYHYLATGYVEEAIGQLEEVVALRPNEPLSSQLIRELRPSRTDSGHRIAPTPSSSLPPAVTPMAIAPSGKPRKLEGTWIARPRRDTTITLIFQHRGHVVWKVHQKGSEREFEGYSIYLKNTLTLAQDQDDAMVGRVDWQDDDRFTFKILGASSDDVGLAFAKSP